jgi:hypothetical protein
VLARSLIENVRRQSIILPALNAIERACAEAVTRANRRIHAALTNSLSVVHRQRLDELLQYREGGKTQDHLVDLAAPVTQQAELLYGRAGVELLRARLIPLSVEPIVLQ